MHSFHMHTLSEMTTINYRIECAQGDAVFENSDRYCSLWSTSVLRYGTSLSRIRLFSELGRRITTHWPEFTTPWVARDAGASEEEEEEKEEFSQLELLTRRSRALTRWASGQDAACASPVTVRTRGSGFEL